MANDIQRLSALEGEATRLLRASTQVNDQTTQQAEATVNGLQRLVANITDAAVETNTNVPAALRTQAQRLAPRVANIANNTIPALQEKFNLCFSAAAKAGMAVATFTIANLTGLLNTAGETIVSVAPFTAPAINAVNSTLIAADAMARQVPVIGHMFNATTSALSSMPSFSSVGTGLAALVPSLTTLGVAAAVGLGTYVAVRAYDAYNAQPQRA